jgi:hypothetical protein
MQKRIDRVSYLKWNSKLVIRLGKKIVTKIDKIVYHDLVCLHKIISRKNGSPLNVMQNTTNKNYGDGLKMGKIKSWFAKNKNQKGPTKNHVHIHGAMRPNPNVISLIDSFLLITIENFYNPSIRNPKIDPSSN